VTNSEDDVKNELALHLAKSILAQAASTREVISRTITMHCTVLIPAHLALLNLFSTKLVGIELVYKVGPLFCWFISLLLTTILLFPKSFQLDFKQPITLIEENSRRSNKAKNLGFIAFVVALFGLIWMTILFTTVMK
jgi:hypothetical protein